VNTAQVPFVPDNYRASRYLALAYARLNRHEDALAQLKRTLEINPHDTATRELIEQLSKPAAP